MDALDRTTILLYLEELKQMKLSKKISKLSPKKYPKKIFHYNFVIKNFQFDLVLYLE